MNKFIYTIIYSIISLSTGIKFFIKKNDPITYFKEGPLLTNSGELIAIGDIHGSINNLKEILINNNIIDRKDNWIASNRIVVQTGNLIGLGKNDKEVLEFVYYLQVKAKLYGGKWIQLLGSHEWMQLHNQFEYVVDGPNKTGFGSLQNRKKELKYGIIGSWLRNQPIVYKWKDTVFVHGGFPNFRVAKIGIERINRKSIQYFMKEIKYSKIIDLLLWDNTLAKNRNMFYCYKLDKILRYLNANRLVIGHTITSKAGFEKGEIGFKCRNKLILIDVGHSDVFKDLPKNWRSLHIFSKN